MAFSAVCVGCKVQLPMKLAGFVERSHGSDEAGVAKIERQQLFAVSLEAGHTRHGSTRLRTTLFFTKPFQKSQPSGLLALLHRLKILEKG
jgi:hypothetical protein